MAAIMQKAVTIDDQKAAHDQEQLTQLRTENQTLRQVLQVRNYVFRDVAIAVAGIQTQKGPSTCI